MRLNTSISWSAFMHKEFRGSEIKLKSLQAPLVRFDNFMRLT